MNITRIKHHVIRLAVILMIVVVAIWAFRYYFDKIFVFDQTNYSIQHDEKNGTTIYSSYKNTIQVSTLSNEKQVDIDGEKYRVELVASNQLEKKYAVIYPNEKTFKLTIKGASDSGYLMAYDENDDPVISTVAYMGDQRAVSPEEEYYHPIEILQTAYYPKYEYQGNLLFFIVALVLFTFSWLVFTKKSVQQFIFNISYGLWVVDPEPSDFYYFANKIGAAFGMAFSFILFFISL